jgi:hypothetical protein
MNRRQHLFVVCQYVMTEPQAGPEHVSSATQETGLLSGYWRATWQQTSSRRTKDKWRFGIVCCLIRTHAEGSVRLDYKGDPDVGLWVFVLTSVVLFLADNCHHVAASILMREFANLKRGSVCGGTSVVLLTCKSPSAVFICPISA